MLWPTPRMCVRAIRSLHPAICALIGKSEGSGQSSLGEAHERGLLGLPLPEGAKLVERTPGDPGQYVDPRERYQIEASSEEIASFYRHRLPALGWTRLPISSDNYQSFQNGEHTIAVAISEAGGAFTLMGS
jgi:hypothetical protein